MDTLLKFISTASLGLVALACTQYANATLIFAEDFDYTSGLDVSTATLDGNGSGADSAWASQWYTGAPGTAPSTTGNKAPYNGTAVTTGTGLTITPTSGTTTVYRSFGLPTTTTSTTLANIADTYSTPSVWLSYTLNISDLGTRFIGLSLFTATGNELVTANVTNGTFTLGAAITGSSASTGVSASEDTDYTVILSLDTESNAVTMYAYATDEVPTSEGLLTGGVTLSGSQLSSNANTTIANIYASRLGAGYTFGTGSTTSIGTFDSVYLGSEYADVVAVPEPASSAAILLTFMAVVVCIRHQRKKA